MAYDEVGGAAYWRAVCVACVQPAETRDTS